jgi:hypothetical protein
MFCTITDREVMGCFEKVVSALWKVSDDAIFTVTRHLLSVRALNPTQTQLPIITFSRDCFVDYQYSLRDERLVVRVIARDLGRISKRVAAATSLTLHFDTEQSLFRMEMVNRYLICYTSELFMSQSEAFDAVTHIESPAAMITVDIEQLTPLKKLFKNRETITATVEGVDDRAEISFGTASEEAGMKFTKMTIRKSYVCDITATHPVSLQFSFTDFVSALRIASAVGTRVEILASEPGAALVVRASNGPIDFHCALATRQENEPSDAEYHPEPIATKSDDEMQHTQVAPWDVRFVPTTVKESDIVLTRRSRGIVVRNRQPVSD